MKNLFILLALLAALGGSARGQSASPILGGNISASSTNCATSFSCVWENVLPVNAGTTTINLSGTFTATLLVEESNNGGQTWSTAATLSAAGTTTYSTNGFTDIRVRCSAYTSGTAVVTISTGLLQVQSVVAGGGVSSVTSGGAQCNGVTDDTVAIQAALNAGGTVSFPNGTCLSRPLTVSMPTRIIGVSHQLSTIKLFSATASPLLTVSSSNVSLDNITIDASGGIGHGVSFADSLSFIRIIDAKVANAGANCVTMGTDSNVLVSRSIFSGCGAQAFYYQGTGSLTANSLKFVDSTFDDSIATAVGADVALWFNILSTSTLQDVLVSNNTVLFNGLGAQETDGIVFTAAAGATLSRVAAVGNHVREVAASTSGNAIEVNNVKAPCTLSGNYISDAYDGILIEGTSTCVSSGNAIDSQIANGASSVGITLVANNSQSNGDQVTGTYTYGVSPSGTATQVIGDFVNLSGPTSTNGIHPNGSDEQIIGNSIAVSGGTSVGILLDAASLSRIAIRDNYIRAGLHGVRIFTSTFNSILIERTTFGTGVTNKYSSTVVAPGLTIIEDGAQGVTAATNFGANLGAQTVKATAPPSATYGVNIGFRQVTLGVGCGAGSNTANGTLSWTSGGVGQTATLNTLTISANGTVGNSSTYQVIPIHADVGTSITFTTSSTLASAGCSTIPQYVADFSL